MDERDSAMQGRGPTMKGKVDSSSPDDKIDIDALKLDGLAIDGLDVATAPPDGPDERIRRYKLLLTCALILGMELCERLAYYAVNFTLVVYLTDQLSFTNSEASVQTSYWSGTCYLFPLLGAWLADSYLGRYWVILSFSFLYTLGLSGLAISASLPSLHPEPPALSSTGQLAFFWFSMYLIALGTGGIKPCVSTFGADQFDMDNPRDAKMLSSFFVYFYCSVNIGALVSALGLIEVQALKGADLVYIIAACAFVFAIGLYIAGTPLYTRKEPSGSVITRAAQVLWGAIRNRNLPLPVDSAQLHEVDGPATESSIRGQPKIPHTHAMMMFDRAALVVPDGGRAPLTVTQVEEFKSVLRFVPLLLVSILWWMTYSMMSTLFILSGQNMDTQVGTINIPSATMNAADIIAVLTCAFLYEHVVTPLSVRIGRPVNLMWRIGFGYILSTLAMVSAAAIEVRRNHLISLDPALQAADAQAPLSIMWQIPQYALIGAAEVCTVVGMMELFYRDCPTSVRSIASSLLLLATGLSNYITGALQQIVQSITTRGGKPGWIADNLNESRLDLFYWMLAIFNLIGFFVYIWCAYKFVQQATANDEVVGEARAASSKSLGDDRLPAYAAGKEYKDLEAASLPSATTLQKLPNESARSGTLTRAV